jgi:hypothetical protein
MRRLLLLLPLFSLALAVPAHASSATQISIMMDDNNLLYKGDTARVAALQRMKALGVDYVRVTVLWKVVAHRMKHSQRKHADRPQAYPKVGWDRYDRLVRDGKKYGIGIYLDVTGPGPSWAMGTPPRSQRRYADTWDPKPREFYKFVEAVGRRYSGGYHDENEDRGVLPRVSFWSIYNEPNQPGWLTPQYKGSTPWSPVLYRNLWYYGRSGLDNTGHKNDIVLIGETAPLGNTNTNPASPIEPKKFIREFFCRSSSYHQYRGASARRRDCSTLKRVEPFNYTAWAHHPYTKKAAPTHRDSNRDAITMANIGELPAVLDRIKVRKTGFAQFDFGALTEFGYETDPPDPFSGVSLAKQAAYINIGDYLAYKQPRIIANTQFLLRDVGGVNRYPASDKRHWFNYQSGLLTVKGVPKPSAVSYRFGLLVTKQRASSTSFWGWPRFLPNGAQASVQMQFKPAGTKTFNNVGNPVAINKVGFFEASEPVAAAGTWRAAFTNPYNGLVVTSREVTTS